MSRKPGTMALVLILVATALNISILIFNLSLPSLHLEILKTPHGAVALLPLYPNNLLPWSVTSPRRLRAASRRPGAISRGLNLGVPRSADDHFRDHFYKQSNT